MFLNLLAFSILSFAAEEPKPDCLHDNPAPAIVLKVDPSELDENAKLTELKKLAKEVNDKVSVYKLEPTTKSCSTISYKFPEIKMNPEDSVYFHIPIEYRDRGVRFMVLGHRQQPGENGNVNGEWDNLPGLSSVQVHHKDGWSFWPGQASGKLGAKFAEVRNDAEIENLYDWSKYGHTNVKTGENKKEALLPDAMKVTSVGKDFVYLSELTLKVNPMKETSNSETIFSKGTSFTPLDPKNKYTLGGGQAFKGTFPGAKAIYGGTTIKIPLEAGKTITTVDVACGDSHQDQNQNSDGGWGQQGWAKLNIKIVKKNGSSKTIMNRENVPPEGVLMASPEDCNEKTEEGDYVEISSFGDTTYVMGVHVGYGN